ncbi:glycerophosphodiester phosphodiesterase [Leucobacter massiliensis]|uniref:Glycerophosphodiester phosphodiesterase n=1 Tax=Leucobacter massiliensis TaxID=1686285 RepID=A0A2S9QP34_9MICO|nr:glycerophosphodiester phosphodiesterase family protein [Leucobacter massiliensis]PRI11342.1 glycerophosphodiester phosphodiesterase [Leucobacter massiliensis]
MHELGRPRVLAHRGLVTAELAALGVADNSRAAVAAAVAAGADAVETDCRVTADGEVVLFHDAGLERVAGLRARVAETTLGELAAIMADRGGLLTLRSALEDFPGVRFNVDVKAPAAAEPTGRIVAPEGHRVLLTSFSDASRARALRAARSAGATPVPATSPGRNRLLGILAALASGSGALAGRALAGLDALQIPERSGPVPVLSGRLLAVAAGHGVEVHVWTVNDPARMRELVGRGVSGVVTDRADVARAEMS